jgi:polysaccharide transporter, PST family
LNNLVRQVPEGDTAAAAPLRDPQEQTRGPLAKAVSRLKPLWERRLAGNVVALYGLHAIDVLQPLIMIPILARVMGPAGWGRVVFAMAFAHYVTLIVEYGFHLSATRDVARAHTKEALASLLTGVTVVKAFMAASVVLLVVLLREYIPVFNSDGLLMGAALFWGISHGLNLQWLFQGLERLPLASIIDGAAKLCALGGVVLVVRGPEDGWRVLLTLGLGSAASCCILSVIACSEFGIRMPSWSLVRCSFQRGWPLFLYRASVSSYAVGNSFLLGFFAPAASVALYGGAEKIIRGFAGLLDPFSRAIYPRIARLMGDDPGQGVRLVQATLGLCAATGASLSIVGYFAAPALIRILLGPGYEEASGVMRVLTMLPFLLAVSMVLGVQWMVPLGLERPFNVIMISAGVVNAALALTLAPRFQHTGMAWAVVLTEMFVVVAIYALLHLKRLDPFRYLDVRNARPGGVQRWGTVHGD